MTDVVVYGPLRHSALLARVLGVPEADLTLRLTAQVTQRAVEAYREISRMQI